MRTATTSLLLLVACLALGPSITPARALPQGATPPSSLGLGPNRKPLTVEQYRGQVLVVTFWASWCGPCLQEMPILEALQNKVPDQLTVVAVNIESAQKFREIRRNLTRAGLELVLANDADGTVRQSWGVRPIPHLFLIDHRGQLAAEHVGYSASELPRFVDEINTLLQQRADDIGSAP